MAVTKSDLAKKVADQFDISQKAANEQIQFILDTIQESAVAEGKACFGKHIFTRKDRAARKGCNPQTKEVIQIPAKTVVSYKYTG